MEWVVDKSKRFRMRPHYSVQELEYMCEDEVYSILRKRHGAAVFPATTDDLQVLIEQAACELDMYADLTGYGPEIHGATHFRPCASTLVLISRTLSESPVHENRLRTTLTHEYGHVFLHRFLWQDRTENQLLDKSLAEGPVCHRDAIIGAPEYDWMEWQAGYASGALLMPVREATKVVRAYLAEAGAERMDEAAWATCDALKSRVSVAFQVSVHAAEVRLAQLGYQARLRRVQTSDDLEDDEKCA